MHQVKIAFSRPANMKFPLLSWGIRLAEWTKYSHVFIEIPKDAEVSASNYVLHAVVGKGVEFRLAHKYYQTVEVVHSFNVSITDAQVSALMEWGHKYSGTKYSAWQLVGMVGVRFLNLFGIKVKNPANNGLSEFVCTELASNVMKGILGITIRKDPEDITLKDIVEDLKAHAASGCAPRVYQER